ncbi:MAG: squalene synthase HpnD [Verrucomicrobiales bacterium]|nr:squalene synthase HpnD [Verrucomicrobiales bacterium]
MTSTPSGKTADDIVRRSRSNLAFALACLPKRRRQDMYVFYAFCRVVDDIADDGGWTLPQRQEALDRWRSVVRGDAPDREPFENDLLELRQRYHIPAEEMLDIIDGVAMDIEPRRYESWLDLKQYCYRVASCVGLVSIRIFGCRDAKSREYALNLGYALQITNILRDVRADWENGQRIYLPLEDMRDAGYTVDDLAHFRHNEAFEILMRQQVTRARDYYHLAMANLTKRDRRPLLAAEAMRRIYSETLDLLEADDYHVFDNRYRLSNLRKARLVAGAWTKGLLGRWNNTAPKPLTVDGGMPKKRLRHVESGK